MCGESTEGHWRQCAGCGRERLLAPGRAVMGGHNRWDSASWSMVPCEGSGRRPQQPRLAGAMRERAAVPAGSSAGDGRVT
jgi:hypothetical protein